MNIIQSGFYSSLYQHSHEVSFLIFVLEEGAQEGRNAKGTQNSSCEPKTDGKLRDFN